KGLRMAGRMGHKRITIRNLEILKVIPDRNYLLVKGGVPGARNTILEIRK
ncbi:50S ribosomal protein L3, partial [bacterium]|nr:50S ribosomal protein L3 [bacterium]